MYRELKSENVRVVIDPHDNWPEINDQKLLSACGILPQWVDEYFGGEQSVTLQSHMETRYTFGLHPMQQGEKASVISKDLTHTFPGDPDQFPLIHVRGHEENGPELVVYKHSVVAMRESPDDEWLLTRMD